MKSYRIINTTNNDLAFVYTLFEEAIAYQMRKGVPVWKGYDRGVLQQDVKDGLQFKIIDGDHILCVFSVCYADSVIWREKEQGDALYLHRIVVNPQFKGQKQFEKVLNWALAHARTKRIRLVRMDTWANNPTIIGYYQSFGFRFQENYLTPDSPELPIQHRNLHLALLEMSAE